LLALFAVSAATFQQQFFSAIVELAIAASLTLPELLETDDFLRFRINTLSRREFLQEAALTAAAPAIHLLYARGRRSGR
jgi:hypothetical protein